MIRERGTSPKNKDRIKYGSKVNLARRSPNLGVDLVNINSVQNHKISRSSFCSKTSFLLFLDPYPRVSLQLRYRT